MLFRKCSESDLIVALSKANEEYEGNLRLIEGGRTGLRYRLGVHNGRKIGARMSAGQGRRGPYASWEAHRDFFRALFAHNPKAVVVTGLVRRNGVPAYTAENFEDTFPDTAYINIGSQMQPVTMPECTIDPRDHVKTRIDPAAIPRRASEARSIRKVAWPRLSLGEFDSCILVQTAGVFQHIKILNTQRLVQLFLDKATTVKIVEFIDEECRVGPLTRMSSSHYDNRVQALKAFLTDIIRHTALNPEKDRIPVEGESPL